jgi:chromosome segregation protein
MVLKKLSIFGFKSFYDKTDLDFGEGLTAIIGPNGCGKSNVVDAVRWVFGEQKASTLRSASMQDVIFSGTQNRQPLNFAEVTITIENNRGILPIEYNEVAITRRVFRSGESEYQLNKTPCRLRDIQDIFLDTGIGSNAYTTIENTMINKILSDKAEERRILFEEAAGIGKYRQRMKEAERKLERTGQDLLRINDRVQEKDRYVRMLSRQVEKARRYQQYRDDLMALEVGFENRHYRTLTEKAMATKKTLAERELALETLRARCATAESKIEKMEIEKVEKENELQIASQNMALVSEKINSSDREISMSRQNLLFLRQNIARFDQEAASLDMQIEEKRALSTRIENSRIERETLLDEHANIVGTARAELTEFNARLSSHKERMDELVEQHFTIAQTQNENQRLQSTCQTNLANAMERRERDEREMRNLESRIEEYNEALTQCKQQLLTESEAYQKYSQSRETLWSRIEQEDERYHEFVEKEKRIEAQIDSCKAQLKFLKGLDMAFEGYESGVKALLTGAFEGRIGILADCISVEDPVIVGLIEKVLGQTIQTVVFHNEAQLKKAVEFLATRDAGMAPIISLERVANRAASGAGESPEGTTPLRSFVKTMADYENLADSIFAHMFVTDSEEAVYGFAAATPPSAGATIVSRTGVIGLRNGTIIAGGRRSEAPGILHRKQEIEKLTGSIAHNQREYEITIRAKENCIINRDEAKRAMVEVDEKLNRGRQRQQEQETNIKHYENEIHNIRDRVQLLHPEMAQVCNQIEEYERHMTEHEAVIAEIAAGRRDLEGQIESSRGRLTEMEGERLKHADHLKNVELAMHGLRHRIEQDTQSLASLKGDIDAYGNARQLKLEDKNKAQADIANIEQNIVTLREVLKNQTLRREELDTVLIARKESYNEVLNRIDENRKLLRTDQGELESVAQQHHALELSLTRDEEQRRAIREKIYTSYEVDLESPPENLPILDKDDADIIDGIQVLRERLKHVGDVNMAAAAEYETENADLQKLILQRDDLQTAVDELERAIRKLNKEARSQFIETFEIVQRNFVTMFTTLFEGGEAQLTLEENVDPLEATILINVRPAGKKMRGVTLLSGGERALTAISLLFALYMVKPSAYCILDELDAPLDDANIERFIRIVRTFSEKTQFIIVTHSKKTMEAADVLYGVTQQESGVSVIASVKLRDIELKAA